MITLAGMGKAFCAGHDLRQMTAMRQAGDGGAAGFRDLFERCSKMMVRIQSMPQPVIAAVQGPVAGGGFAIALAADIRGAKGELIHAAGTRVNPLDSVKLRSDLLFLDGDDPAQIAWALKQDANAKLILVKGAPLELMKARQRRFYFDQSGKLTQKFGIKAVPARVRQNGRFLEVSEIALPRRKAQP